MLSNRTNHSKDNPIVFDSSTCIIKVGFSGDEIPIVYFPAYGDLKPWTPDIFGRESLYNLEINQCFPKNSSPNHYNYNSRYFYPNKKFSLDKELADRWRYIIQTGLDIEIGNHPIMFIEPPNTPNIERKKMAEFLFQQLKFKKIAFIDSAWSSALSMGRHTVYVVELTANRITITPIKGIFRIEEGYAEMKGGGREMTQFIANQIKERLPNLDIDYISLARKIKETRGLIYCPSLTPPKEPDESRELFKKRFGSTARFSIPSGDKILEINIDDPIRWQVAEAFFQKGEKGLYPKSISDFIMESINKCPDYIQLEIKENITLLGGASDIIGLKDRLRQELKKLDDNNPSRYLNVIQPESVQIASWIGGSIESSLRTFQDCFLSEDEFFEGNYYEKFATYNLDEKKFSYKESYLSFSKDYSKEEH